MAIPLGLAFSIDNLLALSQIPNMNIQLTEAGYRFRSIVAAINRCDPFMVGVGMILPAFGFGMGCHRMVIDDS